MESESVLVDRTVTVAGGGGGVERSFNASSGQRIRIVLPASTASMQPYGHLQYPSGTSTYSPPLETAAGGANKIEVTLNQSGAYVLTIFDGSNQGGTVSLRIVAPK